MYTMTDVKSHYVCDFPKGKWGSTTFQDNKNEMRSQLESVTWKKESKEWHAPKTPRNRNRFRLLQGENIYELYDIPLMNTEEYREFYETISTVPFEKLWIHQHKIINHYWCHERCIVKSPPRSGKTLPTIIMLDYLCDQYGEAWFVTAKTAILGIKNELKKWGMKPKLQIKTYDDFTEAVYSEKIPSIIAFDEAHKLKNDTSARAISAVVAGNATSMQQQSYIFMLSGTPASNYPDDWWNLTEICLAGYLRENSKLNLKLTMTDHEWMESPTGGKYPIIKSWIPEQVAELGERLVGLVEVIEPETIDMVEPEREFFQLPVDNKVISSLKLMKGTLTSLQLQMAYRQLSDGFVYNMTKNGRTIKYLFTQKDKQLVSDLEEYSDQGFVIIYAYFTGTLSKIEDICIQEGWECVKVDGTGYSTKSEKYGAEYLLTQMDYSMVDKTAMERPKIACILQTDKCEGLELSSSPVTIFYSNGYSVSSRQQAEMRNASRNSPYIVRKIIDYGYLDIDLMILSNITNKVELSEIPSDSLRKSIERTLNSAVCNDEVNEVLFESTEDPNINGIVLPF